MRRLAILCFSVIVFSCDNNIPNDVLPVEKMQNVMTDILLAEGFAENFELMDTTKKREEWYAQEYSKVMSIHKISQDQFRNSLNFYKKNPDLFKAVVDTVYQRGQRLRDAGYQNLKNLKKPVK